MNDSIYKTHELKLVNRDLLSLSGVKKISNFDIDEFLLNSVMGDILVKGKGLEVVQLDIDKGDIKIKGKINSINYLDAKKQNKESFLTKLFKWLIIYYRYQVGSYQ